MWMSGIVGWNLFSKEFGGNFDVSEVNTDWNCLFNAFAFLDVSIKCLPFSLRGETPEESRFMALISYCYDHGMDL